jgi:hypothetical protein
MKSPLRQLHTPSPAAVDSPPDHLYWYGIGHS